MFALAASIASSVAVSVLLKVARRQSIEIGQAIAVNYPVAAVLCLALLQPRPAQLLAPDTAWWVLALLGILLPSVFLAMAGAVRHAGIVVSDAAQRLSLLIPLAAAFVLFGEVASTTKIAGMSLAFAALACLLWQPRTAGQAGATRQAGTSFLLLLCVWAGYGTIDILFKQMARSAVDFSSSLFASFVLAGLIMGLWLLARRTHWQWRSIAAGVLLGCLNFSNIYFFLRAHQQYPGNPALVFAAMNIGVISLGTLVGAWVFKEKLSAGKVAGVALAVAAIGLLMPR